MNNNKTSIQKGNLLLKVLLGLLIGINVLNWLAPFFAASANVFLQYLGAGIYFLLDPICHQLPQRCLYIQHIPMALCVRCTFLYFGALVGLLILLKRKRIHFNSFLLMLIVIFVIAEIGLEKIGLYSNWPLLRGFSGFLTGSVVVLYFGQFNTDFFRKSKLKLKKHPKAGQ